jgi:NADPH:quinone reductase-like Zn-dependent oxidoreductase
LEVRDVATPTNAAPGHVLIDMDASAINHGDKMFLTTPLPGGLHAPGSRSDVWGASGAGRVVAIGEDVPSRYLGKPVAIYRSLARSPELVGLWCERAQVPYATCAILPEHARPRDYCGSLVNAITAYAFLAQATADGHEAVIVTAGSAATGQALAALARHRGLPTIVLVRTEAARLALRAQRLKHVLAMAEDGCEARLGALAAELRATAVFDGVGGDLLSRIAPHLPMNTTVYAYGFLGGSVPVAFSTALLVMRNLTLRRFSNFESPTVKNQASLVAALDYLSGVIDEPPFRTRIGRLFGFDQIYEAMSYERVAGAKAVLSPGV